MTGIDTDRRDALVERLFESTIGTLELFSVHLGWRLGLYRALRDAGVAHGRRARGGRRDPRALRARVARAAGRRRLPRGRRRGRACRGAALPAARRARRRAHRSARAPPTSRRSRRCSSGVAGALPHVLDAYRSGDGVPYERYGADFRDGQGLINRPAFEREMAGWLAVVARDPRAPVPRRRARRRRRLRPGLLDGRDRARLPERDASTGSTSTSPRSPTRAPTRREPRSAGRVSFVTLDGGALSGERALRPRLHLRGAARHVEAGRGARRRPRVTGARRLGARRRRARRREVHGARRPGRADHVRLERRPLPPGRARRAAVGRARDRAARGHGARASPPTPASRRSRCCRSRTTSSASTGSCPSRRPATSRTRAPRCGSGASRPACPGSGGRRR